MDNPDNWYIVKLADGTCTIIQAQQKPQDQRCWGRYATFAEAIDKRIGLIRANKCRPK